MEKLLALIVCVLSVTGNPAPTRASHERQPQGTSALASTSTKRLPTLDDAYAVKTIGAVEVSPDRTLAALEISGGIEVHSLAPNRARIKRLDGGTNPSWSPDGKLLAFLGSVGSERQIQVWSQAADSVRAVTTIAGGVSQGGLSWAPDSTRLVLGTRLVGDYRKKVCDFERDGMRVYDAQTPVNHLLQEGVFKLESRGGELRKAIDCDPQLGINRIAIVQLESGSVTELKGTAKQYSNPSWSPDGRFIAAIADTSQSSTSADLLRPA